MINLNEIGPAARPVTLPGETLSIKLVRKGRNPRQAVGFMDDGTMIVVEDAEKMIGSTVEVQAHTTFRSSGGTMVFARLTKDSG
ncbi:MAG: TRAM domain-containing protein [Candidatus Aegiribacteria sp.]|nr:TRAM domain-containing protein [Candidatus Aegiribacteria sp.]MBD3295326.1 TRAM domain-containing protein [Candidatus Fermentibacteria bacterium]